MYVCYWLQFFLFSIFFPSISLSISVSIYGIRVDLPSISMCRFSCHICSIQVYILMLIKLWMHNIDERQQIYLNETLKSAEQVFGVLWWRCYGYKEMIKCKSDRATWLNGVCVFDLQARLDAFSMHDASSFSINFFFLCCVLLFICQKTDWCFVCLVFLCAFWARSNEYEVGQQIHLNLEYFYTFCFKYRLKNIIKERERKKKYFSKAWVSLAHRNREKKRKGNLEDWFSWKFHWNPYKTYK